MDTAQQPMESDAEIRPETILVGAAAVIVALLMLTGSAFWPLTQSVAAVGLLVLAVLSLRGILHVPTWLAWSGVVTSAVWIIAPHLWRPLVDWFIDAMPFVAGVVLLAIGVGLLATTMRQGSDVASPDAE